jgi:hypothetical protein
MKLQTKLIAFLAIAMLSIGSIAQAQIISVQAGLNSANVDFSESELNPDAKLGFNGGVLLEFPFGSNFGFQTGLNYTQKGFKVEMDDYYYYESIKSTWSLNYIQIPLLFKYNYEIENGAIFGQLGPYVAVAVHATEEFTIDGFTEKTDLELGDDIQFIDAGFTVGGGVRLQKVILTLSYDIGASNILVDTDEEMKNRVLNVSLGYVLTGL